MYGYAEEKEIALYTDAIRQLDTLVRLQEALRTAYDEAGAGLCARTAELLFRIRSIRNTLAADGSVWESRPYDLLAIQSGDEHTDRDSVAQSAPFNRLNAWERLLAFFRFEDNFMKHIQARAAKEQRSNRKDKKKKDDYIPGLLNSLDRSDLLTILKTPLTTLEKALNALEKAPAQRLKYDVFDNAISYTERIARWQEYTPARNDDRICIPNSLIDTCRKSPYPLELVLFTTMLYRHLKRSGRGGDDLTGDDYWHIPGGMKGLGIYQRACSPETFFSRVQRSVDALDAGNSRSPVHLISLNGEWMANMDRAVFIAFDRAGVPCDTPGEQPAVLPAYLQPQYDPNAPFSSYCSVLFPQPAETKIEKHDAFILLRGDGGLAPSLALASALKAERAAPAPTDENAVFSMIRNGWTPLPPDVWNDFWLIVENYLRTAAQNALENPGRQIISVRLNWPLNANGWQKRASQLILGYLGHLCGGELAFTISMDSSGPDSDAFRSAANACLKGDCEEAFTLYRSRFAQHVNTLQITTYPSAQGSSCCALRISYAFREQEKKPSPAFPDVPLSESDLQLLDAFRRFGLQDHDRDALNRLFQSVWASLRDQPPLLSEDPGSELFRPLESNARNLWAFCEAALLWYSISANRSVPRSDVPAKKEKAILLGQELLPFSSGDSVSAFTRFCRHLSFHWIRHKLTRLTENRAFRGFILSTVQKAAWLFSEEDAPVAGLAMYPSAGAPAVTEDALNDAINKGFRYLLHKTLCTSVPYAFVPKKRIIRGGEDDKKVKSEDRMLYFLACALFFLGYQEGSYRCSWSPEANAFVARDRAIRFSAGHCRSAESLITYLDGDDFSRLKSCTLNCTAADDDASGFELTIAPKAASKRQ